MLSWWVIFRNQNGWWFSTWWAKGGNQVRVEYQPDDPLFSVFFGGFVLKVKENEPSYNLDYSLWWSPVIRLYVSFFMKPCELCCKIRWFFTYPLGAGGRVSHFSHWRSNVWFQAYHNLDCLPKPTYHESFAAKHTKPEKLRPFLSCFSIHQKNPSDMRFLCCIWKNIARGKYLFLTQVYFNN